MSQEKEQDDFFIQRSTYFMKKMEKENCYPAKFEKRDSIAELRKNKLGPREMTNIQVKSAGRVMSMRKFGKLNFYEIKGDDKIQLVIQQGKAIKPKMNEEKIDEEVDKNNLSIAEEIKRGDIVGFEGVLGATSTGELSVFVEKISILSPCLRMFPNKHFGVKEPTIVYKQRYLDTLLNNESCTRFVKRAKIVSFIRKYLENLNFIEVETPMMSKIASGAAAKPFITHHNEMNIDLHLRISPELFLKELVIGGYERVFEIGKQFRNEGIDLTHNPEFTTCEFYMAYADYYDLMEIVEDMLRKMTKEVTGSELVEYYPEKRENRPEKVIFDFSRPFRKIEMLPELSKCTGLELTGTNLEENHENLIKICEDNNITLNDYSLAHVLDKLTGHFIEPQCYNPTFIINHPVVMSPLAKKHRSILGVTERFELFLNTKEIVNAYSELNDPFDQRRRFEEQAEGEGNIEPDYSFVTALEYGLPPTGGVGIGIDRVAMYLTNAANIRDVLLFPTMKED
ncbi:putative lysine--tRNA ligase, cytoplasmic [Dictyocoela muelleri]|nr:putative lysine--tRNA ligase, cytoplasmic [Dictyocoela muelleri]